MYIFQSKLSSKATSTCSLIVPHPRMNSENIIQSLLKIRTCLGVHQRALDPLRQSLGINLKNVVHLADATRGKSLLVNVDIAVVRAPVASINVEIDYRIICVRAIATYFVPRWFIPDV